MSYDPRYSGRGRGGGGDRGGRGGGRGGRGGGGGGGGEGCFKCGQKGHFARECPNPPTSSGAGGRGGGGRGGGRGGGGAGRGGQQHQRTPAPTSTSTSTTSRPTSASTSTSTSSHAWGARATSSPTIATSSSPSLSSSMSTLSIEGFHDIEVPEELETKSESATSEEDLKMSMPLSEAELIPRLPPAKNTKMTVTLMTNFFHVNFANKTIYSHLVKFDPELQPKQLMERRRTVASFGKEIREKYGKFIFDGSTQILNLKPVSDASEFEHKNVDGTSTKINISFIKSIPTSDYKSPEVDMVVNILFKQQLREIKLMQFGRAYFYPEPMNLPQNYPINMFRGFQAAINPTLTGLQLCVDLSHKVIQRRNVRHMMTEIEQQVQADYRGQPQAVIYTEIVDRVNRELKGTMVVAKYNQRNWRIDAIDYKKTMDDAFVLKDGTTISFRNYYLKTYPDSPEVQYLKTAKASPGLLMNIQKKKGKKSQGEVLNSSYLIPELCYLTGITDAQRTDTRLMKILASETRKGPSERVDSISKLILDIVNKQKSLKDQTFPLGIEMNATSVQARILDGFAITFANQQSHRVVAGNASSTGFQRAVMNAGCTNVTGGKSEIKKIGFLGEIEYDKDFRTWATKFREHAHRCSTPVNGIYHVVVKVTGGMSKPQRIQAWSEAIRQAAQQKPECLVCLIANADESIYSFIKHYTTSQLGIITQCIQSDSIYHEKLYMPIIGNSFKQLMAKMNYMLWNIDLKQVVHSTPNAHNPNTMFVGLDVCHDKKTKNAYKPTTESFTRSSSPCSTVGFVASLGKDVNNYYSQIAIQGRYEEYVRTSRDLMINSLRQYHIKNGKFPDRVVVYRDGVGNSQLESFVRKEVREYEYAFTEMKCQPKLTVIVVQKRIPVRFCSTCEYYASNQRCSTLGDRCKGDQPCHSPIPGTCVDTDVVSQLFSDFYLIPSISPPGATSRPTRFIIIRDENHFTSDDIQNMTNSLCYMYYNWPGPIRVPSMCMYAHKIAYLFGKYVYGEPHDTMKNKLFYL